MLDMTQFHDILGSFPLCYIQIFNNLIFSMAALPWLCGGKLREGPFTFVRTRALTSEQCPFSLLKPSLVRYPKGKGISGGMRRMSRSSRLSSENFGRSWFYFLIEYNSFSFQRCIFCCMIRKRKCSVALPEKSAIR